ncbi:large conductance mechanosensitive channel protein MscL [Convivina praedatoris]|uniref:Large-conductance mechanosensitive channel n=1 Tax=Convivina praedatoris TaxID=2880963 RepID=A0ABM9CZT8_9LACO|nr:large conductance mechanosensitive channel protein MscL [Convivina sp. LMG 32447]CAH1850215.1 Large-conductance mechanosensitive channel [Convivina sp. LMG 32447]CAH1850222.1 Large-conductance mechanosensitive channel [Convivina sp. LMG 32447]CAH1850988.1 Large-conductance mechanosensitive channel [Convivina sp. LMG 32447]
MRNFLTEFKAFINRGNIIDLAIGVIIGGAFTGLVKSITSNLINPLIGLFTGKSSSLSNLKLVVNKNLVFTYGEFLNDLINFLITALVVFILVKFISRFLVKPEPKKTQPDPQLEVLQEIKTLLEKNN